MSARPLLKPGNGYQTFFDTDTVVPKGKLVICDASPTGCFGGRRMERLCIEGLEEFPIATEGRFPCSVHHFPVEIGGEIKRVALNIESLKSRLGARRSFIEKAAEEGDLARLLRLRLAEKAPPEMGACFSKKEWDCKSSFYLGRGFKAYKWDSGPEIKGSFARIKGAVMEQPSQGKVVRRILSLDGVEENQISRIIRNYRECRGKPGVVPIHGLVDYTNSRGKRKLVMFLSRADQDLCDLMLEKIPLSPEEQISFGAQMFAFIESLGGAHRDVKLENFLVFSVGNTSYILGCDLDMRKRFDEVDEEERPGTEGWAGPEMFKRGNHDTTKIDPWPAAVILIALFTSPSYWAPPWESAYRLGQKKVDEWLEAVCPVIRQNQPKSCDAIMNLLRKALVVDPVKRISIQEMIAEYREKVLKL
ncbi:MAG TPA: serine/threonine-protein kinase [Chlamydiales bacterium]|nr:serine/threonine-protein kinase [Chlamydiales bacterium]